MPEPIIVITGLDEASPAWLPTLTEKLAGHYRLDHYTHREKYITRLVDDMVALIIVNGAAADWVYWTATAKSSPATRRIPVFLITESAPDRAAALSSGADLALRPDELLKDAPTLVRDFARVPDPHLIKAMDCACAGALPELAQAGFEQFNAGEFYKQHDLFEALWVKTEGPVRDLYRAILQVGVAYYQILRGNQRGALKMLLRSVQWLAVLPDECQGIDVKALREDSYRVRAALEALPPDELGQFDRALLQPLKKTRPTP